MAIAIVQEVRKITDPAGAPGAIPITTQAGRLLVLVGFLNTGGSQQISSVVDDAGNAWVRCTDGVTSAAGFHAGTNGRVELWSTANAAAVTSVTPTISASLRNVISIFEVSGALTAGVIDKVGIADNNATSNPTAGSVTTVQAACLIIGGIANTGFTGTYTSPGAPWLDFTLTPEGGTGVGNIRGRGVTQIVAAQGTYSPVWTTSGPITGGGAIVAFRAAPDVPTVITVTGGGGTAYKPPPLPEPPPRPVRRVRRIMLPTLTFDLTALRAEREVEELVAAGVL